MPTVFAEFRTAIRSLRKARGFTVAAILTLGLGMSLSTIAMVLVNAYLLNGLPYPEAERLFWVRYAPPGQQGPREMAALDWRSLDDVLEQQVAWDLDMFYLLGGDYAESAPGAWITPGFVQGLGIRPAIGRTIEPEAFAPGGPNVALISHRLWTTRYGGDPGILGRTFTAYVSDRPNEAETFTIIGVMPADFWHINPYTDVFAPLRAPTFPYLARLRDGVSTADAAERITALVRSGAKDVPERWSVRLQSAHDAHVEPLRPVLRTVTAAAVLVLLVSCANVAGLLLVRATRRQREVAVRSALGAGTGAIARMLIAEGLLLAGAATAVSLIVTGTIMSPLASVAQAQLARSAPGGASAFAIDARVAAFAIGVGALTAVLCSLVPLIASQTPRLLGALQGSGRSATEGRGSRRLRSTLIALEIAASLTLLAGSVLMLRSVAALLTVDLGFRPANVLTASLTLRQNRYPDAPSRLALFERLLERVSQVPATAAVGLTTVWPVQQAASVPVQVAGGNQAPVSAPVHGVTHGYFEAVQMQMTAGRSFRSSDRAGSEPIAIVSESLARRLANGAPAVGATIEVPQGPDAAQSVMIRRRVVGIVRDVRQGPADEDLADVYIPLLQAAPRSAFLTVRTTDGAGALGAIRQAARDVDPELALDRARPLDTIVEALTSRQRFMTTLLGGLAAAAALLALVGVYGVIAYAVRQREREIAVRLAIGAEPRRIVRMFVAEGGRIIAAGIGMGLVGTFVAGKLVESELFGVSPRDPLALAIVAAAFALAGLAAVWSPARRAAATHPAVALRSE